MSEVGYLDASKAVPREEHLSVQEATEREYKISLLQKLTVEHRMLVLWVVQVDNRVTRKIEIVAICTNEEAANRYRDGELRSAREKEEPVTVVVDRIFADHALGSSMFQSQERKP